MRQLTPGKRNEVRPLFSPDGATLAFRRGWEIWLHSLTDGSERLLLSEDGHCFDLRSGCISPDGAQIVTVGTGLVLLIADVATGATRALTDGSNADLGASWSPSGRAISFVRNGEKVVVTGLDGAVLWEAAPSDGCAVNSYTGTQWARRAEVVAFLDDDGKAWVAGPEKPPTQVTHFSEWPKVKQQPKQVEYPSTGDVKVPALLLEPKDFVPGKSPAVIWVHGGPSGTAARQPTRLPSSCLLRALLDAGFLVLVPNYRGSKGVSTEWSHVTLEQRGVVDVDDVVAGKHYLEESGLAAPGRVAVAGHSYGGYLTLMALARDSQEWACAASLCGAWDTRMSWPSWAGDYVELPDMAQRTPNDLLHRMRRPLLIIHAAYEERLPTVDEVNRSSEVLRSNGTPCELHILEDDHGLPLHTYEAAKLLVGFLTRYTSS